jgi:hypothetical protein
MGKLTRSAPDYRNSANKKGGGKPPPSWFQRCYFSPRFLFLALKNSQINAAITVPKAPAVPIIKLQKTKSCDISIFLSQDLHGA